MAQKTHGSWVLPLFHPREEPPSPFHTRPEESFSPDRNLERMIWERWEEAARVIAKAGMGTWTENEGRAPTEGRVKVKVRKPPLWVRT